MKTLLTVWVVASLSLPMAADAPGKRTPHDTSRVDPLPRDLEIQLALSALPPHLRDGATVYALNPAKGFEVVRKGANGFHAFVARTGDDAMVGPWRLTKYPEDILYPISFDSAGSQANMRVFVDIAEKQAQGTPPQELKQLIQERFRTNYYKAPDRAGISYMLSPILRTYVNPDVDDTVHTASFPHMMHYAPNVSNEDLGFVPPSAGDLRDFIALGGWRHPPHPFIIHHGPHGYVIQPSATARAAIHKEHDAMLRRLCGLNTAWCLPQ
jgi:hypothetical protein